MTRKECIDAVNNVNMGNFPMTIYRDLWEILIDYDCDVADELFEDYLEEEDVLDCISRMTLLEDVCNAVANIDEYSGVYHEYSYREFETADMEELKNSILERLEKEKK